MSSNYYDMRSAKVRIAEELMNRGWEVIGYKRGRKRQYDRLL